MNPLILGIETSCDETGIGIVRGSELLADVLASSVEEQARFGGVVPEVASRAHVEAMVPILKRVVQKAGVKLTDLDATSGTTPPNLACSSTEDAKTSANNSDPLTMPIPVSSQEVSIPRIKGFIFFSNLIA